MVIIEERCYTAQIGKLKAWMEVYETLGKPVQWSVLGTPIGFFQTDAGELQQIVHLWRYDSYADREARRARLVIAPGWDTYLAASLPLLTRMQTRILTPLAFSPLQ